MYAHLPTVLNEQGEKMSKRNGAKPVTQYRDEGYLPDAMVNYLARLGWSHGDDEIFSREQFVQWFNLDHLGKSAAQFDEAKLRWVNAQHMKLTRTTKLAPLVVEQLARQGVQATSRCAPGAGHRAVQGPLRRRCASWPTGWRCTSHRCVPSDARPRGACDGGSSAGTGELAPESREVAWNRDAIQQAIKEALRRTA